MADIIEGPVTTVVDGDTFDMKVTRTGENNRAKYNDRERVRIADTDAAELPTAAGKQAKEALERKLGGKEVRCHVEARDAYGRVVAEVTIL